MRRRFALLAIVCIVVFLFRGLVAYGDGAARQTLLNESGQIVVSVSDGQRHLWSAELASGKAAPYRAAQLHIWIGEYQLSREQQPEEAIDSFDAAAASLATSDAKARPLIGLAEYDKALALYVEGAYQDADDAFRALNTQGTALPGYDRRTCALWLRHAGACAGYHQQRADMGIPEPPKLDQFCGAAALATGLRSFGLPYDKATVVQHCHIDGEGNSLQDLMDADPALGVKVYAVSANDQGLIQLPKPLIAHVEQDHFIAVVAADAKSGVTYLCSDCGPWPGGKVQLTWRQWHALQADCYGVMVRPGSVWDHALQLALTPNASIPKIQVSAAGSLSALVPTALSIAHLISANVIATSGNHGHRCNRKGAAHCPKHACCPKHKHGGGSTGNGPPPGSGPLLGSGPSPKAMEWGPSSGAQVNLATGEEEYDPDPDLTVYNPRGPSVVWQREYLSLTSADLPSGTNLGVSWRTDYDYSIYVQYEESGSYAEIYFYYPNGFSFEYTTPVTSTAIPCTTPSGTPILLVWNRTGSNNQFEMTMPDHTEWIFKSLYPDNVNYVLCQIEDLKSGHSIYFNYVGGEEGANLPPISTITDDASPANTLLTVSYQVDTSVASINDCYGRGVYFSVGVPNSSTAEQELEWASEIVSFPMTTPPKRYQYGYINVFGPASGSPSYGEYTLDTGPCLLDTITVPSPTGSGTAQSILYYDENQYVGKDLDANGNTDVFTSCDANGNPSASTNYTRVDTSGSTGTIYSFVSGFNGNMTDTQTSNFGTGLEHQIQSFDTNDPYRPSQDDSGDLLFSTTPGHSVALTSFGSDTVTGGHSWEVWLNGTLKDSSTTNGGTGTGGWTVSASGNTITVTAPSGLSATHYEVKSAAASPTSAYFDVYGTAKGSMNYTWDTYGNMLTMTDERGTETTDTLATSNFALGDLTTVQETTSGGASKAPTNYSYVSPAFGTSGTTYKNGLITGVRVPLPGTVDNTTAYAETDYTYDESTYVGSGVSLGLLTTEVAPGNSIYSTITTHWNYIGDSAYDVNGHPVDGTHSAYSTTAAIGKPITIINGDGKVTHYRYDARGNCTMEIDALGNETDYAYNIADQMTSMAQYTPWSASPSHSLISTVDYNYQYYGGPMSSEQTWDPAVTAHPVREMDYAYGNEGELLSESAVDYSVSPAVSHTQVSYTYDALYRVKTLTDANSHTTTYTYDPKSGKLSLVQYPGAGTNTTGSDTVQYPAYDADGNLLKRIDGNSVETDYLYNDAASALTNVNYPGGGLTSVVHGYDGFGRHVSMTDGVYVADGTSPGEAFTYDDDDNLLTKTVNYASSGNALTGLTLTYTYNADGTHASMQVPTSYVAAGPTYYPTGTFTYGYDDVGREDSLEDPAGDTFAWSYYDNDWLHTQTSSSYALTTGNPVVSTTYTYDARGELTDLKNVGTGSSALSEFGGTSSSAMTYDVPGNRLTMPSTVSTHTTYSGTVNYYNSSVGMSSGYDYKNELTYETSTGRVPSGYTNTFGYDTAGNFTTLRGTTVSAANPDNQLSATGYTYDGNGNPTSYSGSTLTFDPENRMTSYVSSGTTEMQAGYGADGLRAWRIDNSGNKVYYLYDGDNPVVQLVGSSGSSFGTINLVNCFGANGLINRNFSGNQHSKFYAFDPQGSVAQRVASDGSVDASFAFDSFGGRAVTTSSSVPMNDSYCGFGGQWGYWYDSMTGLELCTHRYYDAANARFVNRDPVGYDGGIDLYLYCRNRPLVRIDPLGTQDLGDGPVGGCRGEHNNDNFRCWLIENHYEEEAANLDNNCLHTELSKMKSSRGAGGGNDLCVDKNGDIFFKEGDGNYDHVGNLLDAVAKCQKPPCKNSKGGGKGRNK